MIMGLLRVGFFCCFGVKFGEVCLVLLMERVGWVGLDRLEWLCINLRWMMVFFGLKLFSLYLN